MSFYDYIAVDPSFSCAKCKDGFEIYQSIKDEPFTQCLECGNAIKRLISQIGGIVLKGRMANQYSDIKQAEYWRDHNGVRHRVTSGDGHSQSPTVSRKITKTPEQVTQIKKQAAKRRQQQRSAESYSRYLNKVKKN